MSDYTFPTPRPHQERAHEKLRDGVRNNHRRQVLNAPTGAGKTYQGLKICHEAIQRGLRATFVCDRTTLIHQTSETADRYGVEHGIIQANHWRTDYAKPFQIASVQTLASRGWPSPAPDVIVIDECHTVYPTWLKYIQNSTAHIVGLSATPFAKGLGQTFTNLVVAATMAELVDAKVLVPMKVFSCVRPDMAGAETANGEWTDKAAEKRELEIVGDVVSEWSRYAYGRKTIVFGPTIVYCEELVRKFNDAGILAAVFSSRTTPAERKALLDEYTKPDGDLQVLVSVEALAKGFDVPAVSCVCDCRPLRKSLSTAIQMWGRGLRSSESTGKEDCILLDFSGNILRFGAEFEDFYHNGIKSLDDGERLDKKVRKEPEEREAKACPECGHSPFHGRCMSCGHEVQKASGIIQIAGVMHEIHIGKGKTGMSAANLWAEVCTYARKYSAPEKQKWRAKNLFRAIAGKEPPASFDLRTAPTVEISREVSGKIRQINVAYANRRAAA